jgi:RNA polymerase sigma-70 factor (ECF subfamily)
MADKTDRELVIACQKGDDEAFQELMHRNIQPIWNFIRQYAKTDDDAEDIAQDTFFKAWKHIKRFQADKAFRPWLYAIARNTALDHLKKRRASTFSELDGDDSDLSFADTLEDEELSPSETFELAELSAELEEAMSVLHPDHRAALVMHYRDQMTFDEIAVIMDKPMNTVKSWHRRAIGKLRGRLPHRKP